MSGTPKSNPRRFVWFIHSRNLRLLRWRPLKWFAFICNKSTFKLCDQKQENWFYFAIFLYLFSNPCFAVNFRRSLAKKSFKEKASEKVNSRKSLANVIVSSPNFKQILMETISFLIAKLIICKYLKASQVRTHARHSIKITNHNKQTVQPSIELHFLLRP